MPRAAIGRALIVDLGQLGNVEPDDGSPIRQRAATLFPVWGAPRAQAVFACRGCSAPRAAGCGDQRRGRWRARRCTTVGGLGLFVSRGAGRQKLVTGVSASLPAADDAGSVVRPRWATCYVGRPAFLAFCVIGFVESHIGSPQTPCRKGKRQAHSNPDQRARSGWEAANNRGRRLRGYPVTGGFARSVVKL